MHIRSLVIAVGVDIAVNNINVLWVAMEMKQWVSVELQDAIAITNNITQYNNNITSVRMYYCLSYTTGKSLLFCAVLCCHLWPVWLYYIFPHYLIEVRFSAGVKITERKNACFDFLYNFCFKHLSF